MTSINEKNEDSELNMSDDVRDRNNPQNADHERMLTKHDIPNAETEHEKSETKKTLFGDDRQKVDITEVLTVIHPLPDEHKGVLSEQERNAIQKGDYIRVVVGWHNSWPRKHVLVCPQVLWAEVVEVQQYHLIAEISKPPRLFGPDYDPRFLIPKTAVTDVRNGKYSVPRELHKGECPLCGHKRRK